MSGAYVTSVDNGSIAHDLGIEEGDLIVCVNSKEVVDYLDYKFLTTSEEIVLGVKKKNGEMYEYEIENPYMEDLGINFSNMLFDNPKSCHNKCIFCFIDQMPKGMRDTLYFKDDDSRLSFLQGNYVTLTNMSEHDINRIIQYHLSPINISFQTTNPELRCMMLNNRFAGEALKKVDLLAEAGIVMNGQIVLCKGVNDGAELERSIRDLTKYAPLLESVSVVPVGLSKYREGLYPLEPFTKEDAKEVLKIIHTWQEKVYAEHGIHFIHASDEWYILAEEELPEEERYDGYLQLENGVGMLRLLQEEFAEGLKQFKASDRLNKEQEKERQITVATGLLAQKYIQRMAEQVMAVLPKTKITVVGIRNDFFGERITVSGLLTGQDIIKQLSGKDLGDKLLLPQNVLRSGEDVFLDDIRLDELQGTLQVPVDIVKSSGQDFLDAIIR